MLYGLSVAASAPFAFSGDEMCFNLVRGDLSVGGDNGNFICITLLDKQSLQTARRERERERKKQRTRTQG